MQPRINPVSDPDEDQLARLAKTPLYNGDQPLNLFATLAHRPQLLSRVNALGGCLMLDSSIAPRERELAILRIASSCGCDYELTHHRSLGAEAGLTEEEIAAAVDRDIDHAWSSQDRALLGVTDELDAGADVSDAAWAALDGVLEPPQRIELLVLVGFYRMLAGFLNGARVEIDERIMTPDGAAREVVR